MNNYNLLISCTSWEDRFVGGFEYNVNNNNIDRVLLFGIADFMDRTIEKSNHILKNHPEIILGGSVNYIQAFDDVSAWKNIENVFSENSINGMNILLDVSTMPRYLIWFLLHFLTSRQNIIDYCYFSPERYEDCDWLTDEPLRPRLIFKHSGLYLPNQSSILVIQSGFDVGRVSQLIRAYEPEKVFLGAQIGEQLDNLTKNLKQHKERLNFQEIEYFSIDAFDNDHGNIALMNQITPHLNSKNIVLASFGPKLLAVEMFKINSKNPEVGLVDVPVKKYNERYSHGTDFKNIQYGHI
ncbi:MAG: hypothetical protein BVN35_16755 [Proteobacteria bacterium ST_bin11]|nr:MAG: hypothetical protein BVN35_16755 [Proteobacteria bacterium ST_bin11]